MELHFQLTREERIEAVGLFWNQQTGAARWSMAIYGVGFAFLSVPLYLIKGEKHFVLFGVIGAFFTLSQIFQRRTVIKRVEGFHQKTPVSLLPTRLEAGVPGLRVTNDLVETFYQWPDFTAWHETPHLLLLDLGPGTYVTVPKRVFVSSQAETEFRALLSHINAQHPPIAAPQ